MKILSQFILALLITSLICPMNLWSANYFIRADGHDTASGLNDTTDATTGAWALPSKASATMVCGDTAQAHNGTYTESGEVRFSKTTDCAGGSITLKNFPGEQPHLTWTSGAVTAQTSRIHVASSTPNSVATPDVTVQGFLIDQLTFCVKTEGTLRFTFTQNTCQGDGAHVGSGLLASTNGGNKDMTITRNLFKTIGTNANLDHCLYLNGTGYVIANNIMIGCKAMGVVMDAGTDNAGVVGAGYGGWSGKVAFNTMAWNPTGAAFNPWNGFGTGITSGNVHLATITGNIVMHEAQTVGGSAQVMHYTSCGSCDGSVTSNVWFTDASSSNGFSISSTGSTPAGFSQTGNVNANASLINAPSTMPGSPDLHPTSTTHTILHGPNLTGTLPASATLDYDGNQRPTTGDWTPGAYQYGSAPPPPIPVPGQFNLNLNLRRATYDLPDDLLNMFMPAPRLLVRADDSSD